MHKQKTDWRRQKQNRPQFTARGNDDNDDDDDDNYRKPSLEAPPILAAFQPTVNIRLAITYLQFPIQLCFLITVPQLVFK